jgi:hypothetical protein
LSREIKLILDPLDLPIDLAQRAGADLVDDVRSDSDSFTAVVKRGEFVLIAPEQRDQDEEKADASHGQMTV